MSLQVESSAIAVDATAGLGWLSMRGRRVQARPRQVRSPVSQSVSSWKPVDFHEREDEDEVVVNTVSPSPVLVSVAGRQADRPACTQGRRKTTWPMRQSHSPR